MSQRKITISLSEKRRKRQDDQEPERGLREGQFAVLVFPLPEEQDSHRLALDGGKWYGVLWEVDQWLRGLAKHGNQDTIKIDEVRHRIHEEMQADNLSFD